MNSTTSYMIGRSADNHLVVDQPGVSRQHARVTFITDREVMLEDNKSTNGTFVDGRRISRTVIGPHSHIVFGHSEPIDPQSIFALRFMVLPEPAAPVPAPKPVRQLNTYQSTSASQAAERIDSPPEPSRQTDPLDYRAKFRRLAGLYETYTENREYIQIAMPKRQGWLRAVLGLTPLAGIFFGQQGIIIGVVCSVVGLGVATEVFNPTKRLLTLDKEFKRTYVCPSCGTFLGNVPYTDLARRKQCRECKAKWAD